MYVILRKDHVPFKNTSRLNIISSNAQDILLQLKGILPEAIQRPFSKKARLN